MGLSQIYFRFDLEQLSNVIGIGFYGVFEEFQVSHFKSALK